MSDDWWENFWIKLEGEALTDAPLAWSTAYEAAEGYIIFLVEHHFMEVSSIGLEGHVHKNGKDYRYRFPLQCKILNTSSQLSSQCGYVTVDGTADDGIKSIWLSNVPEGGCRGCNVPMWIRRADLCMSSWGE